MGKYVVDKDLQNLTLTTKSSDLNQDSTRIECPFFAVDDIYTSADCSLDELHASATGCLKPEERERLVTLIYQNSGGEKATLSILDESRNSAEVTAQSLHVLCA